MQANNKSVLVVMKRDDRISILFSLLWCCCFLLRFLLCQARSVLQKLMDDGRWARSVTPSLDIQIFCLLHYSLIHLRCIIYLMLSSHNCVALIYNQPCACDYTHPLTPLSTCTLIHSLLGLRTSRPFVTVIRYVTMTLFIFLSRFLPPELLHISISSCSAASHPPFAELEV